MQLTEMQEKVIKATEPKILCLSCAAAGKTTTLAQRINYLIEEWGVNPEKILAFTFTNQAAEEMKKKISQHGKSVTVCTIHSYANKICKDIGMSNWDILDKEDFDKLIDRALIIGNQYYKEIDHLFVDEVQDTNPQQFKFIEKIPAKNRFYCGDDRQFIYGFRGSTDRYIKELAANPKWKKYFLLDNFRNPKNIVEFAENILGDFPQLSPSCETHLDDSILEEEIELVEVIDSEIQPPYGDWAFLCRNNTEVQNVHQILRAKDIPSFCFAKTNLSLDGIEQLLSLDKVKVMTIHTAKGLEFPNVVVIGAKNFNEEERRISYVAATRAQHALYWCNGLSSKKANNILRRINKTIEDTNGKMFKVTHDTKGNELVEFN